MRKIVLPNVFYAVTAVSLIVIATILGDGIAINAYANNDTMNISEATAANDNTIKTNTLGSVDENSLFQIGSISKFACSLAIFDMEKDGLLSLDDSISTLIPEYTGKDGDKIKLIHLLQNRSGLEDGVIAAFRKDQTLANQSRTSIEATNSFASSHTKFSPGAEFDYIISNWIVVQAILEKVDNAPISTVLKKRVFDKAGMDKTSVFVGVPSHENIAPHTGSVRPVPNFLSCAGGVMSTARDTVKLVRHPYHTAGFTASDLEKFTRIATDDEQYALGGRYKTIVVNASAHKLSWQSGSNGPYKSIAVYDPVSDKGYAVLTGDNNSALIADMRDKWLRSITD